MTYLLDTNVISELRKRRCDPAVRAWVRNRQPLDLYISVVTALEIETGILQVERRDSEQAARLRRWFEEAVLVGFAGRVLPFDLPVARQVARLHVPDRAPAHDAQIAGTALAHGMTVVTRNITDFERTGVLLVNPWSPAD